jgi:hypothetical protein
LSFDHSYIFHMCLAKENYNWIAGILQEYIKLGVPNRAAHIWHVDGSRRNDFSRGCFGCGSRRNDFSRGCFGCGSRRNDFSRGCFGCGSKGTAYNWNLFKSIQ